MGGKKSMYQSYGEKLIRLFVKLLFSGESYSLTELSRMLECSKQTVIRLIDDIEKGYGIRIELSQLGNRHYYRIKRPEIAISVASISEIELNILQMCRDFTAQLLGKQLFEEATLALLKSQSLVTGKKGDSSAKHFATIRTGTIDYTPHHDTICTLIEAMKQRKICQVNYQAITETKAKTFSIMPLKLFSHKDTIYLHARLTSRPGKMPEASDYDPLLAVQRIKKIQLTEKQYEQPDKYDFEKIFNKHFGIIKDRAFKVEVEFTGWAAQYISERMWSPDQKIKQKKQGRITLEFAASSEPEVVSWVLSFGKEAKLISPDSLIKEVSNHVAIMNTNYLP